MAYCISWRPVAWIVRQGNREKLNQEETTVAWETLARRAEGAVSPDQTGADSTQITTFRQVPINGAISRKQACCSEKWRRTCFKNFKYLRFHKSVKNLATFCEPARLGQVVGGYFHYHAVPANIRSLGTFRFFLVKLRWRTLRRRSRRDRTTWKQMMRLANEWLAQPRVLHPSPHKRFSVRHPRREPYARIGL